MRLLPPTAGSSVPGSAGTGPRGWSPDRASRGRGPQSGQYRRWGQRGQGLRPARLGAYLALPWEADKDGCIVPICPNRHWGGRGGDFRVPACFPAADAFLRHAPGREPHRLPPRLQSFSYSLPTVQENGGPVKPSSWGRSARSASSSSPVQRPSKETPSRLKAGQHQGIEGRQVVCAVVVEGRGASSVRESDFGVGRR